MHQSLFYPLNTLSSRTPSGLSYTPLFKLVDPWEGRQSSPIISVVAPADHRAAKKRGGETKSNGGPHNNRFSLVQQNLEVHI